MYECPRSTIAAHNKYLVLARNTVWNMAFENQAYTTSLVYAQPKAPNTWWSPNYDTVTCNSVKIHLPRLREGIQTLIDETWAIYYQITNGRRFATRLPAEFVDDISIETRGFSFLLGGNFTDEPNAFLIYLCSKESPWNLGTAYNGERMSWNIPDLRHFLATTAQFNRNLSVLAYLLPTVSTRVTEFLATKFANDSRRRNIVMMLSEMVDFRGYHKMTNQTGLDVCMPVFYPESLKALVLEHLCGGMRDAEILANMQVYGEAAAMLSSRYAFNACIVITI